MRLDTRGLVDGFLRGYDVMQRHRAREANQARADNALALRFAESEREEKRREQQAQQQAERHQYQYGKDGKGGRLRAQDERTRRTQEMQLAAHQAQRKLSQYRLGQEKKRAFLQENQPLIQAGWGRWLQGGDVDAVFDSREVKGGAYDPRRYLRPDVEDAFATLETALPKVIQGDIPLDDETFVRALGTVYQKNLEAVVGQRDPNTGRRIRAARMGIPVRLKTSSRTCLGTSPVSFDRGGGGWFRALASETHHTEPNHGRGRSSAHPPIGRCHSRSDGTARSAPSGSGFVGVSNPLCTVQRHAWCPSRISASVFGVGKRTLESPSGNVGSDPEHIKTLNEQFDAQQEKLRAMYLKVPNAEQSNRAAAWAQGDETKQRFLEALQRKGWDVARLTPDVLAFNYQRALADQQRQRDEALVQQLLIKDEPTIPAGIAKGLNAKDVATSMGLRDEVPAGGSLPSAKPRANTPRQEAMLDEIHTWQ